jgi:YggT family protein
VVATIFSLINILLNVYYLILVARVLLSWFRVDPYSPLVRFLYTVTEPILEPIRAVLPQTGMIDFSPMVAMVLVFALQQVLRILAMNL